MSVVALVPAAGRGERLGERVGDDVAVGVAGTAVDVRPVQARDRAGPAGLDRVDVGADADPRDGAHGSIMPHPGMPDVLPVLSPSHPDAEESPR